MRYVLHYAVMWKYVYVCMSSAHKAFSIIIFKYLIQTEIMLNTYYQYILVSRMYDQHRCDETNMWEQVHEPHRTRVTIRYPYCASVVDYGI